MMGGSLQPVNLQMWDFYTCNHDPLTFLPPAVMIMVCGSQIENQYSPSYPNILRPAFNRNTRNCGNGPLLMVKKRKE
jgi:hypothetical protein